MGDLINAKKAEIEQRHGNKRKVALFILICNHLRGIIYAIAELYLGYKPDLNK